MSALGTKRTCRDVQVNPLSGVNRTWHQLAATSAFDRFCCRKSCLKGELAGPGYFRPAEVTDLASARCGRAPDASEPFTLQTERDAHTTHSTGMTGGGRATSLASRLRFCAIAASVNSNCAPLGPRRRNRSSRRMRLRCANSISTFLRSRRDCANACVLAKDSGDIACGLIHVAFDPSCWHVRAALRFERAGATLRHGAEILDRVIGADMAASLPASCPLGIYRCRAPRRRRSPRARTCRPRAGTCR